MPDAYPEHLLAREPAPPYLGEGPFALWHVSEQSGLRHFVPRGSVTDSQAGALVWAVDTRHLPTFWFPRDCPRGCIWPSSKTTPEDHERFFGQSGSERVHLIEAGWLARVQACRLFAYRFDLASFRAHDVGGYWVAEQPVDATDCVELDDLLASHAAAGIELRIAPSIWPFWRRVITSTVEFSGSRLRNAAPHPDRAT